MPRKRIDATALPGKVALVLQGGGALSAYQVGAFQALDEAGYAPDVGVVVHESLVVPHD